MDRKHRNWIALLLLLPAMSAGGVASAPSDQTRSAGCQAIENGLVLQQACCRICSKGKACGNSCIARDKNCHQPPGCACDG